MSRAGSPLPSPPTWPPLPPQQSRCPPVRSHSVSNLISASQNQTLHSVDELEVPCRASWRRQFLEAGKSGLAAGKSGPSTREQQLEAEVTERPRPWVRPRSSCESGRRPQRTAWAFADLEALVDAVLPRSGVARLRADSQVPRDIGHRPLGGDQVQHLAPKLRRISTPAHAAVLGGQVPKIQLRNPGNGGRHTSSRGGALRVPRRVGPDAAASARPGE